MSKSKPSKPLVDLSEEEQWKIINETGVLHKLKEETAQEPHLLIATLLSIPLIVCHGVFDYLAHAQFGLESDFTFDHILKTQIPALPAIWIFAYVTNYFKKSLVGQLSFAMIASALGCMVVALVNDDGTFGAARKTPGLITMGVLLIIQADLQYSLLPIFVSIGYYYRHTLQKYVPTGSLPSLKTEL
jgi:hypothetical protein